MAGTSKIFPDMPMQSYNRALARASQMYDHRDEFCYLYGAKGLYLDSEKTIRNVMAGYPDYFSRYSEEEIKQIIKNSLGKVAFDCSGFVGACFDWLPQNYSAGYYSNRVINYPNYATSRAGCMIFQKTGPVGRHIMIDGGSGVVYDCGIESTDWVVNNNLHSIRKRWMRDLDWSNSYFFGVKGVNYDYNTDMNIAEEWK